MGVEADLRGVERLRAAVEPPAEGLLATYFDPAGPFAGATFDRFGENAPGQVGSEDLLAVSMLDVPIKPLALRRLLGDERDEAGRALAVLPVHVDLWDADDGLLDAVDAADDLFRGFEGIGPVVASKLLSRKRPRLVPVIDSVVLIALGQPGGGYKTTRRALARWLRDDAALRDRLFQLASGLPGGVSPLRALDVAVWMRGSRSRTARRARVALGLV